MCQLVCFFFYLWDILLIVLQDSFRFNVQDKNKLYFCQPNFTLPALALGRSYEKMFEKLIYPHNTYILKGIPNWHISYRLFNPKKDISVWITLWSYMNDMEWRTRISKRTNVYFSSIKGTKKGNPLHFNHS